jgi:hypothetical protein
MRPRRRLTDEERVLRSVLESKWQEDIIEKAEWLGWEVMHIYDSRRTKSEGWPDLILCKPPRLLAVELKRETEQPTDKQLHWLGRLMQCNVETYVWRPRDVDRALTILQAKPSN